MKKLMNVRSAGANLRTTQCTTDEEALRRNRAATAESTGSGERGGGMSECLSQRSGPEEAWIGGPSERE